MQVNVADYMQVNVQMTKYFTNIGLINKRTVWCI